MQPRLTANFESYLCEDNVCSYMNIIKETYTEYITHRMKLLGLDFGEKFISNHVNEFCCCICETDIVVFICKKSSNCVTSESIIGFILLRKSTDKVYNAYIAICHKNIINDPNINTFDLLRCLLILNKKICIERSITSEGYAHIEHDSETIKKLTELCATVTPAVRPIHDKFCDPNTNGNVELYVKIALDNRDSIPDDF